MIFDWLDAAPVSDNMSCNCCVVASGGGLSGGSTGALLSNKSWVACVACVPGGGDEPRYWESCSNATNLQRGCSTKVSGPPVSS